MTWFDAIDLSKIYLNEGDLIASHTDSAGVAYVQFNTTGQPLTGNPIRYGVTPNRNPAVHINQLSLTGGWATVSALPATNYVSIFALWKPVGASGVNSYISHFGQDPFNIGGTYLHGEGRVTAPFILNKDFGATTVRQAITSVSQNTLNKWMILAGGRKADSNVLWGEKNGISVVEATTSSTAVNSGTQDYRFYRCGLGTTYVNTYMPVGMLASEIVLNYDPTQADKYKIYKWMFDRYIGSQSLLNQ